MYLCTQHGILRMAHGEAKQTPQEWDATTLQMSREQNSVALKGRQMKEVRLQTEYKLQLMHYYNIDEAKWNCLSMFENWD